MSHIQPYYDYSDHFLETTTVGEYDKSVKLQRSCLRRYLLEIIKVDKNEIYNVTGIYRLKQSRIAPIENNV